MLADPPNSGALVSVADVVAGVPPNMGAAGLVRPNVGSTVFVLAVSAAEAAAGRPNVLGVVVVLSGAEKVRPPAAGGAPKANSGAAVVVAVVLEENKDLLPVD